MSRALAPAESSPPSVIGQALRQAGADRSAGRLAEAASGLAATLERVRADPLGMPFLARVQLGIATADACLDLGDRARARQILLDESGYAERIFHLTRLSGTPEQVRAASAGRLQVRDRAIQVGLLGQPAPEIAVADWVLGGAASLADLRGQVVLLEFWATWCRPCLNLLPRLAALHERYGARGLEILALSRYGQTPPTADPAEARARERGLVCTVIDGRGLDGIRVGIAADGRLQRQYGATAVPTLVLIDRGGLVRLIGSGGDEATLKSALERCLAE
jgi:thiol-disulfide isomerase/thioredoxin